MIIVDKALERIAAERKPVRVGLIGSGYMGRGIALQIISATEGMILPVIANRTLSKAKRAYFDAGINNVREVSTVTQLEEALSSGVPAVTEDAMVVCQTEGIDAIIEATGTIEFAAHVVLEGIRNKKHIILMNAELDATLGPILKVKADKAGVVITNTDGDQPGVIMNLFRFVKSIGCRPVLAGNMKGLQDPYRTPETQKGYAEKYHQKPHMVTSFADGTKISMEMAIVANATGFRAGQRGMFGPRCQHANEAIELFPKEKMLDGGLVDYILGAEPAAGVFIIGYNQNPIQQQYLNYYKMGDGPFYIFYTPYHLCHLEVPLTAARAVLFQDAAITPLGRPVCDVVAVAKQDLLKGDVLDGIGQFMSYGVLENSDCCRSEELLPMGLASGSRLIRDIPKDTAITYNDVHLPENRLCDVLRNEQNAHWHS